MTNPLQQKRQRNLSIPTIHVASWAFTILIKFVPGAQPQDLGLGSDAPSERPALIRIKANELVALFYKRDIEFIFSHFPRNCTKYLATINDAIAIAYYIHGDRETFTQRRAIWEEHINNSPAQLMHIALLLAEAQAQASPLPSHHQV